MAGQSNFHLTAKNNNQECIEIRAEGPFPRPLLFNRWNYEYDPENTVLHIKFITVSIQLLKSPEIPQIPSGVSKSPETKFLGINPQGWQGWNEGVQTVNTHYRLVYDCTNRTRIKENK